MELSTPLRILVVEVHPHLARGTCRLMEQAGHTTTLAGSGDEALQCLRARLPHLVLLDRHLPDMDGLDVCRQIKADPATESVLVVVICGHHGPNHEQLDDPAMGADGYIVRPKTTRNCSGASRRTPASRGSTSDWKRKSPGATGSRQTWSSG